MTDIIEEMETIEIKPTPIFTKEPYFSFEVKNRGICFQFYIDENKHVCNKKLVGLQVKINKQKYLVKGLERVYTGDDGTNQTKYSILVEEIKTELKGNDK